MPVLVLLVLWLTILFGFVRFEPANLYQSKNIFYLQLFPNFTQQLNTTFSDCT